MTPPSGRKKEGAEATGILKVGLTGGIGTGKSVVAEVFQEEGAFVLDADPLGHSLMEPGTPGYRQIREAFGDGLLAIDGRIDRKKLAALVFSDSAPRIRLNGILHPLILEEARRRLEMFARHSPGGIAVTQAALIVEAGIPETFDRVVVTHCDPAIQIRRLRERDGISEVEATARIRAQAGAKEKTERADYVIDTGGSLEETRERARHVYRALRTDWEKRENRR